MSRVRVLADKQAFTNRVRLLVVQATDLNRQAVGRLVYDEIGQDDYAPETLTIDGTAAQELIDELWRCGLRPSEGAGSAGALAATERHLEDMRRLVFKDATP